jgi:Holliday junction resolvasome RuvABC endonuclease subunit
MLRILGLDISSSTIGWSLVSYNEGKVVLTSYGHIKPPTSKAGSLALRMSPAFDEITELFLSLKPDVVAIESYVNKFSPGRSSARTIIVLSSFNEMISMACFRALKFEAEKYTVARIRSVISKEYNIKLKTKDDVFDFVKKEFPNFKIRLNRNKTIAKTVYDESDSIAVALASIINRRNING